MDTQQIGGETVPADDSSDSETNKRKRAHESEEENMNEEDARQNLNRFNKFYVLDDLECDEDGEEKDSTSADSDELSDSELYKMLEDPVESAGNESYTVLDKIVMCEKTKNHFEVLPDGWINVTHECGMPVYLHRPTRVCSFSKPYFLGPGSLRKHEVPISAIPCLEYRQAKEMEKTKKTIIVNGTELPSATVQTAQENNEIKSLNVAKLYDYCSKLFEFKTIKVTRFKSWPARRKFCRKRPKKMQRPALPGDMKLITCPSDGQVKEWIMNPDGKSYVCILHTYLQRVLKQQPVYEFKEVENAATPYSAIIRINGMQYGVGYGSSKKQAKLEAAKDTLENLIPEIKHKINQDSRESGRVETSKNNDLSFFDDIKITDPRVPELCEKTTEPAPHTILLTCLQRNFSLDETSIKYETKCSSSRSEFSMTVGSHSVTVECSNKRDGKQKASQAILQKMHPYIDSWASLLRLYGNQSIKIIKEKKLEEQEITSLQSQATAHSPNYAILNKLFDEMTKLCERRKQVKPIGVFVPPEGEVVPVPSPEFTDIRL